MLCSEKKGTTTVLTCGYRRCGGRFQMLTSHRLSLSFYFCFHDTVTMMFYVTMQWVKWLSVSSFVVGLRTGNPHGERRTDLQREAVSLSNWSPWQQSKILSCLLLVDVVIIMLTQITVIRASMYRSTRLPPPPALYDEVYFDSTQAKRVIWYQG